MIDKVYVFLVYLAFAKGIITRNSYFGMPSDSSSYDSNNNDEYNNRYATPAPIYEDPADAARESELSYFESLNIPFGYGRNIETRTNVGAYSFPGIYTSRNPIFFNPTNSRRTPINKIPGPLEYATQARSPPAIKTFSTPPAATTPGLSTYASHQVESQTSRVDGRYSDATAVSHSSFNGFGTSYTW